MTDDIKRELNVIETHIGDNYTPAKENILKFLEMNLSDIKVVILGQDPYPQEGVATGRCFEVGTLSSWQDPFRQVSLRNIVRALYKSYNDELLKYSEIKKLMVNNKFNILEPNKLFKNWEEQGVLLLNTYFTCEVGKPGSHKDLWEKFSIKLIEYISSENKNIKWFLWGSEAIKTEKHILGGNLYKSRHPMMCSEKYEDDFLKNQCFRDTKGEINWLGR
jgi:uracil-DNA glycosylase